MAQEHQRTTRLDHAEEIDGVAFPAAKEAPEVFQPGEEAFRFPSAADIAVLRSLSSALVGAIISIP
jgi:hypothetical protein